MLSTLFRRPYLAFTVASLLTVLVAVLHTLGLTGKPPDATWADAYDSMRQASVAAGPFEFTLYEVLESVWIQVGVLLVLLALSNLVTLVAAPEDARRSVVRALSALHGAFYILLAAFFWYYRIPPPLLSFALLAVAFGVAWLAAGRSSSTVSGT